MKYIDPLTEGRHPLRASYPDSELPQEVVDRVLDAITSVDFDCADSVDAACDLVTEEELAAFQDHVFDLGVAQRQTHEGSTVLN